jgi:hypothetical protein
MDDNRDNHDFEKNILFLIFVVIVIFLAIGLGLLG